VLTVPKGPRLHGALECFRSKAQTIRLPVKRVYMCACIVADVPANLQNDAIFPRPLAGPAMPIRSTTAHLRLSTVPCNPPQQNITSSSISAVTQYKQLLKLSCHSSSITGTVSANLKLQKSYGLQGAIVVAQNKRTEYKSRC
jgi:hypothetical protein